MSCYVCTRVRGDFCTVGNEKCLKEKHFERFALSVVALTFCKLFKTNLRHNINRCFFS